MIEKKDFNKLKQLDRIEFRQKYEYIEKKFNIFESVVLGILMFLAGYLISFICSIFGFILIFIIIRDLVIKSKMIKELESEYFKVEVK